MLTVPRSLRILSTLAVALGCLQVSSAEQTDDPRLIDLTHSFDEQTIYWPTEAGFKLERGQAGVTDLGYYYVANRFTCAEHGGTHIDAPRHFAEHGQTVDQMPAEGFTIAALPMKIAGGSGGPCRIVAILEE